MSNIKATDGYEIQVGDVVVCNKGPFGIERMPVHRVTEKFAFVRYNDVAEGKFNRVFKRFGFSSLPRQKWPKNDYHVEIQGARS